MTEPRPTVRTVPTIAEWADAIAQAWRTLLTYEPTNEALSVLWAQFALETGRGHECFNWNLGNIKATPDQPHMVLQTFEYVHGTRVNMPDNFRAFDTLEDGALDYLRFLTRPSYAEPWSHVVAGDPEGFARSLKRHGYFTAPVEEYVAGLRSLSAEFAAALHQRDTLPAPAPDRDADTVPGTPTSKSNSSLRAVAAPIIDGPQYPANPLGWQDRAEREAENDPPPPDDAA